MKRLLVGLLLLEALCGAPAPGGRHHRPASPPVPAVAGPVDIAALAREQGKDSLASPPPAEARPGGRWIPAAAVLTAAAGTVLVLYLLQRRRPGLRSSAAPVREEHPEASGKGASGKEASGEETAETAAPCRAETAESPAVLSPPDGQPAEAWAYVQAPEPEASPEERAALLAERMQCGRGETSLALRLESGPETALRLRELGRTAPAHRIRAAKRLGVGRGEVDLAMRLRALAGQTQETHR